MAFQLIIVVSKLKWVDAHTCSLTGIGTCENKNERRTDGKIFGQYFLSKQLETIIFLCSLHDDDKPYFHKGWTQPKEKCLHFYTSLLLQCPVG